MKQVIFKTTMLVAIAASLLSFTKFGGEGFEIFLNNKVVVQQFAPKFNAAQQLRLGPQSANDQLTIKYHHCGRVGKSRVIAIKDMQDKTIKEWRFADAAIPVAAMQCNVKEILNLGEKNGQLFKLFYSSTELPQGRLLTNIMIERNVYAANK